MNILFRNLGSAVMITTFVFVMMLLVDYLCVLSRGKVSEIIKGGLFKQYIISALLGTTPGCLGTFMCVSFYVHGMISFGALAGCMFATAGDESFVMFTLFPGKALLIHLVLCILGIIFAYLVDIILPVLRIRHPQVCISSEVHSAEICRPLTFKEIIKHKISYKRFFILCILCGLILALLSNRIISNWYYSWEGISLLGALLLSILIVVSMPEHYLIEHIWQHIIKKHLWKVFLWTIGALLVVDIVLLRLCNLEIFIQKHMMWILFIASLVAIVPQSGPHLIFLMLFKKGIIPFSVLLTNSIIQDGHGMLPLLSYTFRDALLIKLFNLFFGLCLGIVLYSFGL